MHYVHSGRGMHSDASAHTITKPCDWPLLLSPCNNTVCECVLVNARPLLLTLCNTVCDCVDCR